MSEQQVRQLSLKCMELTKQNTGLKHNLNRLQNKIKSHSCLDDPFFKQTKAKLQAEARQIKRQREAVNDLYNYKSTEKQKLLEDQRNKLKAQLFIYDKQRCKVKKTENQQFQKALKDLQAIKSRRQQSSYLRQSQQAMKLRNTISTLNESVLDLKEQLQKAEEHAAVLSQKNNQYSSLNKKLQSQIGRANQQLQKKSELINELKSQIEGLRSELQIQRQENQRLSAINRDQQLSKAAFNQKMLRLQKKRLKDRMDVFAML